MKNAQLLLSIGNSIYSKTKNLTFLGPIGLGGLLITLLFCGEHAAKYLTFSGWYPVVNILIGVWYLLIAIGFCVVFPYFMSLILIGIGQIAQNTDPSNHKEFYASDELPDL